MVAETKASKEFKQSNIPSSAGIGIRHCARRRESQNGKKMTLRWTGKRDYSELSAVHPLSQFESHSFAYKLQPHFSFRLLLCHNSPDLSSTTSTKLHLLYVNSHTTTGPEKVPLCLHTYQVTKKKDTK